MVRRRAQVRRRRLTALTVLALLGGTTGVVFGASDDGDGREAPRAASAQPTAPPSPTPAPARAARPGDLVISGVRGVTASEALLARAKRGGIAGVILMGANIKTVAQVRRLTGSLQRAARAGGQPPLLITVDQEGGSVKRFSSAAPSRSATELSRLPLAQVQNAGRQTGRDLRARGVNVNLAPVVDVKHSKQNFLKTRTFGTTPAAVTRNACSFARGMQSAGVLPTLKHFPGLGTAGRVNTDLGAVSLSASLGTLRKDWAPYRECGRDPGTLIMLSNASYRSLTGSTPAVLSTATYKAARELGLRGPFITDALGAVSVRGIPNVASKAVRAGANLVLYTEEQPALAAEREIRKTVNTQTLRARAASVLALRESLR